MTAKREEYEHFLRTAINRQTVSPVTKPRPRLKYS
jgi:hypothetical protein